ncbi:copper transport protein [Friedmanniella luteola]|uniref:Copper transport protein n=1 Tax=Friedmanniella luteola TaxID=546871 RepID=A0A1H2AC51_9ACTN|nr:copper resistance protein CopC [Friedmanniella luteola]SDT43493.1 copper transport protein [Friedmanniella luteola]
MRNRRRWARALGLLAALLLGAVLGAPSASAHTRLVDTVPADGTVVAAAPGTVELRFNEPVTVVEGGFALYDSTGRHTVDGVPSTVGVSSRDRVVTAALPTGLARGSYLLGWRVVSADGHPVGGAVAFAVGAPSATPPSAPDLDTRGGAVATLRTSLQVLSWLGLLGGVGLWVFRHLVLAPGTWSGRGGRLVVGGLALAVTATLLLAGTSAVEQAGGPVSDLADGWAWQEGLGSGSGAGAAVALVTAGALLLLVAGRLPAAAARGVGLLGSLVALSSVLATGHTRTVGPTWVMALLDLVHVSAAAVWSGGLLGLGLHLLAARRRPEEAVATAAVVVRFSALAGVLVGLLGVSGLAMATLVLERPADLTGTGWGRALLAKLALVAVVGVLAAWNRYSLVGAVRRRGAPAEQWRRLRAAVVDEAAVVVVALAVTGVLVGQSPSAPAEPGSPAAVTAASAQRAELGTGSVQLSVAPGGVGTRTAELTLRGPDGAPLVIDEPPRVSLSLPEQGLGPLPATVRPLDQPGRYAVSAALPVPGAWQLLVSARTSRFDEPTAVLVVPVNG